MAEPGDRDRPARALSPFSLPPLRERGLENGLRVIVAERRTLPLVSACLVLPFGSARDPSGKAGLSEFTIDLLRRGTARRSAEELDELLERMGVDLRLASMEDSTFVCATAPSEHLKPILELMGELLREPVFHAREVRRARTRTLGNLATALDDPATVALDAVYRAALGDHPYAHPARGLSSQVRTFTRKDCLAHHAAFFRPGGAFLALSGDASAEEVFESCERSFGRWKSGPAALAPLPRVLAISTREILLVDRPEATQAQVRMACVGPDRRDPKLIAARLSNQVFGSGFTSRLVNEIRVNRGLSYGVSTGLSESEAGGLVVFASFTKSESMRELIDVFLDQAARYREEGPSEEELLRAQQYTNGLFPLGLETVDQMARAIAETRRYGRGADWLERYRERVLEVTRDEAREVARRYFFTAGHAIAVVGRAKALIGPLRSLGRVRVVRPESLS